MARGEEGVVRNEERRRVLFFSDSSIFHNNQRSTIAGVEGGAAGSAVEANGERQLHIDDGQTTEDNGGLGQEHLPAVKEGGRARQRAGVKSGRERCGGA
jgi:hypothetical protein